MSGTEVSTEAQIDIADDLDAFSDDFFGRKSPEAPATTEAAEQEDADDDAEVAEVQKEDPEEDVDPEAEFKETPPKKKTFQDRVDELVKQREDIKREGDQRLEQLRKEFEEKIAALQPKTAPVPEAGEPKPTDLNADGTQKYELGEFDPHYIRDLTRHTLEVESQKVAVQRQAEHQAQVQQQAAQELQTGWNTKVEAAKEAYPDLIEKGQALLNGFNGLPNDYANYLSTILMSMDKGPDVLYYLSNNPQEAREIVNSGAQRATLALGRIEAKFLDADAQKQLAKPKVSKAPVPPGSNRARGTNGAFVSVAADTDDLEAFEREFFKK